MLTTHECPRCRGTMALVQDIDDTYYSCVQCGHVVYGRVPAVAALRTVERWRGPESVDRGEVRRRQIRRQRALARRVAA